MSPYQALYGRLPMNVLAYRQGAARVQSVEEQLLLRDEVLRELKVNLLQAQHRMEQQANRKRRDIEYQIGDLVLVKLQPYRQQSVVRRGFNKLAKKYYGPFSVMERIGDVAYRLELPQESKIHPVFHVSLLKSFRGSPDVPMSILPADDVNGKPILTPSAICKEKMVWRHGQPEKMVLVQWSGSPPKESTWEYESDIATLYPDFDLEGKVLFPEEGDDTSDIHDHIESEGKSGTEDSKESTALRISNRVRNLPVKLQD